ncbi:MXAN_6640 family putative metalloprotease [Nocardioides cynanchi]|uniref:MXAN_6640 family putative metalloprotease n=1 Tax=Nocardioides cynanchi TaxID=2558918 RepID=UPI001247198A|nr:MXAN_6640 family putative metalloprotease [Nocardioides cynanchi]
MRRSVAAVVVALSTALTVTSVTSSGSAAATGGAGASSATQGDARAQARAALHSAQHALSTSSTARPTDPTMALLHLRLSMGDLSGSERRQAAAILARPTDHPDFFGQTYTVKAKKKCRGHICIHWVPTTADAPPNRHWVNKMLKMMNQVWSYEVGRLGYRPPLSDGHRGGNGRFDVYLKELFHQGLYGLTTAERPTSYNRSLYSGYLLLDNDFARSQYGAKPIQVARVTAAHEFFHAIQFGYDVQEDSWLMEATSTWMEDQFDDSSNDNRQYLPFGQLAHPDQPLDTFEATGAAQYGNWAYFEHLSHRFGRGIVRQIWHSAAAFSGGGDRFSAHALRSVLSHHGGFDRDFARYSAGNLTPGHSYPEGGHYPSPPVLARWQLTGAAPSVGPSAFAVPHLASGSVEVTPGADLTQRGWRLRLKVAGPRKRKDPVAYVVVHTKKHGWIRKSVALNRYGNGRLAVPFSNRKVDSVTLTVANASTSFRRCGKGAYSCSGSPRYPHPAYSVTVTAFRR